MFGKYADMTVTLPAQTEAVPGTVLGEITTTHALTPYKSGATDGSKVPCCILAQSLKNEKVADEEGEDDGSADFTGVRVLMIGEILDSEVVLANSADKLADITISLKNNGILVINAQKGVEHIGD